MARFDVHRNTARNAAATPFVVVLQSSRLDRHARRLVAPLVPIGPGYPGDHPDLTPVFTVDGRDVALEPMLTQSIPRQVLGPIVGSLAGDGDSDRIIKAIDLVPSRAWG